jgi:MFS family permease
VSRDPRPRGEPFYGWKLVGALCVILFFTGGGGLYVFPVFIGSFQEEFGWSMTEISGGAALFAIMMGLSAPAVGLLFARFGARRTMLAAGTAMVLALLGYAALLNLWMLYAILVVSGFGVAGTTVLPAQTLVTNWFHRFRGRAMGFAMLGIGAGGFLLPPLNEFLIRLWGWRYTWVFSSLTFLLIVLPLIALFVRTRPADLGLLPDGASPGEEEAEDERAEITGLPVRRAVATPTFWMVVAIYLLQLIGLSALNFHFVPFATQEAEFSSQQAALFYGLAVGFSIAGRLLFGWLADRWKVTLLMAAAGISLAIGPAVLELLIVRLGLHHTGLLWLYSVPFGTGIGGHAVIMPMLVGRCFGELHFSKIMGLVMSGFALGIIVGIPLAGWIFDRTGSYEWAFLICLVGLLASALIAALIRPQRYHAEFETAP